MENLQLPHARLFYFAGKMFKEGLITDTEKCMIKEYVIIEKIEVFYILEDYEKTKDENKFSQSLINLVRRRDLCELADLNNNPYAKEIESPSIQPMQIENSSQQASLSSPGEYQRNIQEYIQNNPSLPEEISSPYGTQLMKKKKNVQKESINYLSNILKIQPQQAN